MPTFDDTKLALGDQSSKDKDINDKRLSSLGRLNKLVKKVNLPENVSIEMLESPTKSNYNIYLIQTVNGTRHEIGLLDIIESGYPYPCVQMSYVNKDFQGKGYSKLMYKMAIKYLGGLVSDAKLTGEHVFGSFHLWQSLSKHYYSYVIDALGEVSEVGSFDKSMMKSDEERFMVSDDDFLDI